jgi:hypothetical protein
MNKIMSSFFISMRLYHRGQWSIETSFMTVHLPSVFSWDGLLLQTLVVLMMEAVSISETSANFYQITQRNIPEDSRLQTLNTSSHRWYLQKMVKLMES